jgi:hypothetical protein
MIAKPGSNAPRRLAAPRISSAGRARFGNLPVDGEEKQLREFRRGRVFIDLWYPWRSDADEAEFSRLRLRYDGSLVLELRWSRAGTFNVVKFVRGEWERHLN